MIQFVSRYRFSTTLLTVQCYFVIIGQFFMLIYWHCQILMHTNVRGKSPKNPRMFLNLVSFFLYEPWLSPSPGGYCM